MTVGGAPSHPWPDCKNGKHRPQCTYRRQGDHLNKLRNHPWRGWCQVCATGPGSRPFPLIPQHKHEGDKYHRCQLQSSKPRRGPPQAARNGRLAQAAIRLIPSRWLEISLLQQPVTSGNGEAKVRCCNRTLPGSRRPQSTTTIQNHHTRANVSSIRQVDRRAKSKSTSSNRQLSLLPGLAVLCQASGGMQRPVKSCHGRETMLSRGSSCPQCNTTVTNNRQPEGPPTHQPIAL